VASFSEPSPRATQPASGPADDERGPIPSGTTGSPRRAPGFLWIAYLIWAGGLTCFFYLVPALSSQTWMVLGLSAVVATVVGVRLNRPRQPWAWYLLGGAVLCLIAGDTTYNVLTEVLHQDNPFPSVADGIYLLTYPLFAGGIFLILRARSFSRDIPSLLDAVIITTGLGLLSWVYLIVPNFQADGLNALQRVTSVAYPVGDVLVLAMLARLVAGGGLRIRSMRLLVAGALGLIVADGLYGLIQLNGEWKVGGPVDFGWALFYIAWGAAALHPSMRELTKVSPLPSVAVSRLRIVLLASASLIAPGVLFLQAQLGKEIPATTVAVFSAVLFILVLARMAGILGAHQQSVRRERSLRTLSEALVAAQGLPDIYKVALDGVESLIGEGGLKAASVYRADADEIHCMANSTTSRKLPDEGALWEAARRGGHLSESGAVSVNPLRYDLQDRGMLVVEGSSALSIEQHHALATLASQVALAVVSATLAEELRDRQSQEQFRGMIQNASDIIVVVDEVGLITYGTPSLERGLGHPVSDLLGTPLIDLLHPDELAMAETLISGLAGRPSQSQVVSDWRLRHEDGRYLFFEVLASNLLDNSSVSGVLLTMRDVSERRALEQQLMHQAFHDELTGLPNRALFQDRVEHALARAARRGGTVAMALMDLDDFKIVNDTLGHGAGDALLGEVAQRLQDTLRSSTTIARLGGDEFAILIEDITDSSQVAGLTDRILRPFRTPFVVEGEELVVSASIGLVLSGGPEPTLNLSELLQCADLALYAAKERGKGRVELYRDDLHTRMMSRATLRTELDAGMKEEQFELYFQPVVVIDTGEIQGSEVLIRWNHPTRGLVMPGDFIAHAEETGQIVELGRWVLDHACAQWREWADQGYASHSLAVNVSVRQLQEAGFVDEVRAVLTRHTMSPTALVIELTESIFALDAAKMKEQLVALRDMGVRIAIDDFGTGYSSLSYLQQFQIDEVKVDKAFVDGLGSGNPDDGALANAIVSMSHSLRLEVVAEGIEEAAQRDELWSMGCGLGQGYLYSRPVPADDLLSLLNDGRPLGKQAPGSGGKITRLRTPAPGGHSTPADADSDTSPKPGAAKSAHQKSAPRKSAPRKSAARKSVAQKSAARESAPEESVPQESVPRKSASS
jgi:diguanylate cyclase (GGDEF)-like protein/PAS domain S-box-containing protein